MIFRKNQVKIHSRNKWHTILAVCFVVVVCVASMTACNPADEENKEETPIMDIDQAIAETILSNSKGKYLEGECAAEGHAVFGTDGAEAENYKVYAVASYGEYSFMNNMFIKVSGSGAIPVVITLSVNAAGEYAPKSIEYPLDGSMHADSINKMFPEIYREQALKAGQYYDQLQDQEHIYAQKYLEEIGRTATIGEYKDLNSVIANMNVEASNTLISDSRLYEYPIFIGTAEKIEGTTRYVYEKKWEDKGNGDGIATYVKYKYKNKEVVEEFVFEINNGVMKQIK